MKVLAFALFLAAGEMPTVQILAEEAPIPWRILIANDTCPDVTCGFTETQVRQAFADLIAAHLDEMTRTDALPPEDRDHYNATAFIEVEAFLEIYPQRQGELLRRIREGRLCVSPFLCNSLWGFQSVEGALRTFYPARRMEREHGMPIGVAEHIELPSLPWGMASLMAGCGIRWTSVPFLDYDSTFKGLNNPPLFRLEGPDGTEVRVLLDAFMLRLDQGHGGATIGSAGGMQMHFVAAYFVDFAQWWRRIRICGQAMGANQDRATNRFGQQRKRSFGHA